MTEEHRALHRAADSIEPRVARAVERAMARLRDEVKINDLALRLAARDGRGAMRLVPTAVVEDVLGPAGRIAGEAVARGGRVAAEAVIEARAEDARN